MIGHMWRSGHAGAFKRLSRPRLPYWREFKQ